MKTLTFTFITLLTFMCTDLLAQNRPIGNSGNVIEDQRFKKGRRTRARGNERSARPRRTDLEEPVYRGTGCPRDTASVALSPDSKTLSILFDEFVVEAGGESQLKQNRKNCTVSIPFSVEPGYQVAVVALDYRGYNYIPEGGRVEVRTAHFFHGARQRPRSAKKVMHHHSFRGPVDEDYILSGEVSTRDMWSPCGQDINLHIQTNVRVGTNRHREEVLSTVDSLDADSNQPIINSNLEYHLLWRECRPGRRRVIDRPSRHPGRDRPIRRPRPRRHR